MMVRINSATTKVLCDLQHIIQVGNQKEKEEFSRPRLQPLKPPPLYPCTFKS